MIRTLVACVVSVCLLNGCAGMIAGSPAWFDGQKSDVQPKAAEDLACKDAITYKPVNGDDYRQVEARGCGKKVVYTYTKVGPVGSWSKGEVTSS